ncbi:MAG: CDC27 family protein [Flavobacteriaceae bacterium]|nr:CDC27 family protein [Flavobacteriaceae bacterium]
MKNIDLIDKYFENNLTPKEQLLFNDLLHSDEEFKSEFVFQKDLKKVISITQTENLKSTLQNFEKNINNKSKVLFLPKKWLVAASIILLVGFGFWFINNSYFPSNEQLYTQNFEPYRNIVQPVVRGESINSIEYKAFVAYENKNYHKAINLYNSVDNTNADYIQFYKAMCYLSLNKTNEAINLLLPVATSSNKSTSDKNFDELSNWYLGLAYLKNGENEKALSQFSLIANHPTNTFKQEEAKEIIDFIN